MEFIAVNVLRRLGPKLAEGTCTGCQSTLLYKTGKDGTLKEIPNFTCDDEGYVIDIYCGVCWKEYKRDLVERN